MLSRSSRKSSDGAMDSLPTQFRPEMSCEANKPDFKELDLRSPSRLVRTHARARSVTSAPATSSSSSSSGSLSGKTPGNAASAPKRSEAGSLSGENDGSPTASRRSRPGHRRSSSGGVPLMYSPSAGGGGGSVNSPPLNVLPSGNICPSGRIGKSGIVARLAARTDVLGSGTGNYGHGSIMRGRFGLDSTSNVNSSGVGAGLVGGESAMVRRAIASSDSEEVKTAGNELYKRGNFAEALSLYDRAISISPNNASCRCNRAAALIGLRRLPEAVKECEEALRLDPTYARAHQRLGSLFLRLGQVENARSHLVAGQQPESGELQKLQAVEWHLVRCADARKIRDWNSALRESGAAIAAGADSSPPLFACRAEALLKLHKLLEAKSTLLTMPKFEFSPPHQTKFFGMLSDSYLLFVRAQIEMALGNIEDAVLAAEKAVQMDPHNIEVAVMLNNVKSVARARVLGNDLYNCGKISEACIAYGEGLRFDPSNPILYCNRAACRFKLGELEKSIDDCNEALKFQPKNTKALLRRAACYFKLELWAESVRDYEVLRKECPDDKEVAESLFHSLVALKKSRGVEEISDVDQFRTAISSTGVSVVHFMVASNQQCLQMSSSLDSLCMKFPSLCFLKVDVDRTPEVAKDENVRTFPTFKIYKNGTQLKEMICPSQHALENSLRHCSI